MLLVPTKSDITPKNVSTETWLTPTIALRIPIISATINTVTESRLAIALIREGKLSIIHHNLSIETQADEVDKIKRSESGMIVDPITLEPDDPLTRTLDVIKKYHIS